MNLKDIFKKKEPVLLLLTRQGTSLQTDTKKSLEKAELEGLEVIKISVDDYPDFADEFQVGKHSVLVLVHQGKVISRRNRPWGTDTDEIVKHAKELLPAGKVKAVPKQESKGPGAPVTVTDATFQAEVMESNLPVLVDFWAEWCGPCKAVAPVLEKLAKEFVGRVKIAKVDVDVNPILSQQLQIRSIPTMMFVKDGKIVGQSAGAAPETAIRDALNQLISLDIG